MNRLPYYKAYPRDFFEGTIGMPFEMKGGYRIILDLIYMQSGDLPDDARYIAGLLGCSVRKWKSIRIFLINAGKIQVNGDFISNSRARVELETLSKLQDKQRENRTGPNKNKGLPTPKVDQPEPEPYKGKDIDKSISKNPKGNVSARRTKMPFKADQSMPDREFEIFWSDYGRCGNKKTAKEKFIRVRNTTSLEILQDANKKYINHLSVETWKKKKDLITWLNQECWNDEYLIQKPKSKLSEDYSDWEEETTEQGKLI